LTVDKQLQEFKMANDQNQPQNMDDSRPKTQLATPGTEQYRNMAEKGRVQPELPQESTYQPSPRNPGGNSKRKPSEDASHDERPNKIQKTEAGPLRRGHPWTDYRRLAYIDQGGEAIGAMRSVSGQTSRRVAVKQTTDRISPEHARSLLAIDDSHIVRINDIFIGKNMNFLVYEMMYISLRDLTACELNFTESQVALLCRQVRSRSWTGYGS